MKKQIFITFLAIIGLAFFVDYFHIAVGISFFEYLFWPIHWLWHHLLYLNYFDYKPIQHNFLDSRDYIPSFQLKHEHVFIAFMIIFEIAYGFFISWIIVGLTHLIKKVFKLWQRN